MSEFDFPELPSDEELGITDEDREQYGEDVPDDGPELSDAEMAALLGESPSKGGAPKPGKADAPKSGKKSGRDKPSREERKAARAGAKEARKAEKEAARKQKDEHRKDRAAAREARAEAAAKEAPAPRWRGPVTLVLLLALSLFASSRTGIPDPVPANAPATEFASARAMATLAELFQEAHPTGSPEHARLRSLLMERLQDLGLEPEVQTTTSVLRLDEQVRTATVRNIVARVPGTDPTGAILVTAHYDSREIAVGAGDDGSGVVAILEGLRALREGAPLANDLIVLFTDAEELGLLGARAFVEQHRWMTDVDVVLSFEMRGGGGPSVMFETNEENGWIIQALDAFDPAPFTNSLAYEVYRRLPRDTDFTPFKEAGVQGLNFAAIDRAAIYHQTYDRPENISEATLQHHGTRILAGLRWLGDADLASVDGPNHVYFSVPGFGLFTYPAFWVQPTSGALLVFFALLLVVARRRRIRWGGVATSLGLAVGLCAAAFGAGWSLPGRLTPLHPEAGALQGALYHSEGWYVLALALAALALTTGLTALSRRWLTRGELLAGALALPVIAAVAAGFVAPMGAVNLQWAAMAGVAAAVVVVTLGHRATGMVGWLVALLLAAPVFLLLQYVVELVWLAMSISIAGALGVLMTLGFLLCLPALEALGSPNRWWAPAGAAVAALAALGVGVLNAGPGPDAPLPTTLVYAYEHGTGQALWATSPDRSPAAAQALTWAESRAGGAFDESRDLTEFGYPLGVVPVRRAPVVQATPPRVDVLRDSVASGERTVTLGIRSEVGAEQLAFFLDDQTRLLAINGVRIAGTVRAADHWGIPEEVVTLDLSMPAEAPVGLHVVEHLLRPEDILGDEPFQRDPGLAPNVNGLSDRAMLRFSVAAFSDPRHAFMRPSTENGTPLSGGPVADSTAIGPEGLVSDTVQVIDTSAATDSSAIPDTSQAPDTSAPPDTGAATEEQAAPDTVAPVDTMAVIPALRRPR